jgi:hypothetical protein
VDDWQPITDDTPKDRVILVINTLLGFKPVRARWAGIGGTWAEARDDGSTGGAVNPTHWKPLK